MKIVIITDVFLKSYKELYNRGSVIILWNIIKYIKKKYNTSFEVYQMGDIDDIFNYNDIKVNVIKSKSIEEFIKRIKKINFECDILHFNNMDCYFNNKFKCTAIVHTNAYIESKNGIEEFRKKIKQFNKIITVNKDYYNIFKNNNLVFIPNGIDLKLFKPKNIKYNKNIFFPNNPTPKKNVDFAFDLINKLGDEYRLYVADDKSKYSINSKNIIFIGSGINQKEMVKYYNKCFYVIVPSLSESCSLCALESMAMKKRLIANDIDGLKNYVKYKLISCNDIDLWIKEIKSGFNDKIKDEININYNNTINSYDSVYMAESYYIMWKEVLDNYEN